MMTAMKISCLATNKLWDYFHQQFPGNWWNTFKSKGYSPQSSSVIKSKMAATTIRKWTSFRPPKICLHCRLELSFLCLGLQLNSCLLFALPWWRCVCGYGTTIYQPFTFKRFVWRQSVNFSLHCMCQMYDYSMNDSKVAWISDDYFESFLLRKRKLTVQTFLGIRPSTEK